ncbi:MAG: ATP-dependent Clp protease adaptor ClpS [Fimbriimonas sp.]
MTHPPPPKWKGRDFGVRKRMNHTVIEPEIGDSTSAKGGGRWMVVIYNNDTNDIDEVIDAVMRATGCDPEEAFIETWEAHHFGKAPVHFASKPECEDAASVISAIGVRTEVSPEWED